MGEGREARRVRYIPRRVACPRTFVKETRRRSKTTLALRRETTEKKEVANAVVGGGGERRHTSSSRFTHGGDAKR
jgi:hypothetical protein